MGRLEGKTALVTGSNQNIGRAVVELFAKEGANVVVNGAHDQQKVEDTVEAIRDDHRRRLASGSIHEPVALLLPCTCRDS